MRVEKFVLNRAAFRDQILKGAETRALLDGIESPRVSWRV